MWEQVRRRLKGRQPGGRRRSKGFRLVPSTRSNGVCRRRSSASRSETDKTSAWADKTGYSRFAREARARGRQRREREMIRCSAPGRRLRRHRAPRIPYRSKATARKTTPRQRPRPRHGLDGRPSPLDCSERKNEKQVDVF